MVTPTFESLLHFLGPKRAEEFTVYEILINVLAVKRVRNLKMLM